jgi:hypothetical protein
MESLTGGRARGKMANKPDDLMQTLAHHDAAISTLGGRMTGVERGMATLQTEVHTGFNALNTTLNGLNSKIDKFDARPQFDFHKTVGTIVAIAVLFSMICAGIIYITNSQNAALVAEQKSFNTNIGKLVEKHDAQIESINGWRATIQYPAPSRGAMK